MKTFFSKLGRVLLPLVAAASLSGCAVYESSPPYTTVTNPDGTQSTIPYACPEGYTCSYPEAQSATHTTVYAYDPYPYVWPLAFLGLGYTFGHYHHHHYPRWRGWGHGWRHGWRGRPGWRHGWRGRGPRFGGPRFGRGFGGFRGGRGFGGFRGGRR